MLPVLNNLLENREMHLEDGRLLIPASRYDKLLEEHSQEELDGYNFHISFNVQLHEIFKINFVIELSILLSHFFVCGVNLPLSDNSCNYFDLTNT